MNLRRTIKRFNTLYGKKKRVRIELPEERDAKAERSKAREMGFKNMDDYRAWKKKKKEDKKPWYAGRSSGRFEKLDSMPDYSESLKKPIRKPKR